MRNAEIGSPSGGSSRRDVLKQSMATALAMGFPTLIPGRALGLSGSVAPSNRVALAVIGTGNQGFNDINSFLKDERVQIVAVCDVNRESAGYWEGKVGGREPARRLVEEHYAKNRPSGSYRGCAALADFREVLSRGDIDAVEICTPDHWHAIMVVEACKAKKDIYCQKPLSLTVAEGRTMSSAVSRSHVVFQTGSQQRSDAKFRRACELVRNGRIGALKTVRVGLPSGRNDYAKTGDRKKPEPVPEGFDYNFWLGPAPEAPYAAGAVPRQLPLDLRLLWRAGDRLGRPPPGLCSMGHGHRADRPDRDPERQRRVPPRPALEHCHRVPLRGYL